MQLLINRFRFPEIRQAARLSSNSEDWWRSHPSFRRLEFGPAPSCWGKVATTVNRRRAAGPPQTPVLLPPPGPNTACPVHYLSHACTLTHLQWCILGSLDVSGLAASDTLAGATQPGWSIPSSNPRICPLQPQPPSGFLCSFACGLTSTEVCLQPSKVINKVVVFFISTDLL